MPEDALVQLEALSVSVIALITRAQKHGRVVVITNAETGWVQLSCRKFMPRVVPFLSQLRVLSARSTFEALHPDSPSDWKVSKSLVGVRGRGSATYRASLAAYPLPPPDPRVRPRN